MKNKSILISSIFVLSFFVVSAEKVDTAIARIIGKNYYYQQINYFHSTTYDNIELILVHTEMHNDEPIYYVFNLVNRTGFILLSAQDNVKPVLGYSFESDYSLNNQPPSFSSWVNNYKEQIIYVIEHNMPAKKDIKNNWLLYRSKPNLSRTVIVSPLIKTNWSQGKYYNSYCPLYSDGEDGHISTGCVATAMGQIMKYWNHPMQGRGSHSYIPNDYKAFGRQSADFGNTIYEWDKMIVDSTGILNDYNYAIAKLLYHCGVSLEMSYNSTGTGGSAANFGKIPLALNQYFNYSNTANYIIRHPSLYGFPAFVGWIDTIKYELDNKRPVCYCGDEGWMFSSGHAFICDGYDNEDNFHFNFGWNGAFNGYYNLDELHDAWWNYSYNQRAIISIIPVVSELPYDCIPEFNTYMDSNCSTGNDPIICNQFSNKYLFNRKDFKAKISSIFSHKIIFQISNCKENNFATSGTVYLTENVDFCSSVFEDYLLVEEFTPNENCLSLIIPNNLEEGKTKTYWIIVVLDNGVGGTPNERIVIGPLTITKKGKQPDCQDPVKLTAPLGALSDGSGMIHYDNNLDCNWLIQPDSVSSITLEFLSLETENNDMVKVYDGNSTSANLIGEYSGFYSSFNLTSTGGSMFITFNSNDSLSEMGWVAKYISVPIDTIETTYSVSTIFRVAPNPSDGHISILYENEIVDVVNIEVLSLSGQSLYKKEFIHSNNNEIWEIDLSSLSSGIYFIRITDNKFVKTKKLIIQ